MAWVLIIVGLLFVAGGIIFLLFYYERSSNTRAEQIKDLQDRYDPNITPMAAKREMKRSEVRTEMISQMLSEATAVSSIIKHDTEVKGIVHENENKDEWLRRDEQLKILRRRLEEDTLMLQQDMLAKAKAAGLDVASYTEVMKQRALNAAEIERLEASAQSKLKGGILYKLADYQKVNMLRGVLDDLYEQEHLLLNSDRPEEVVEKKLEQVRKDIELHQSDLDARRQRLLQDVGWQDPGRGDEAP
ncbi:MAG: hypothetical protein JO053_02105 [Acidobacteria bacterium]|nr:hypothetical protein [Acidobacteriota bacterium]